MVFRLLRGRDVRPRDAIGQTRRSRGIHSEGVTLTRATRTAYDVYHADAALAGGNGVCDKISTGDPYPRIVAGSKTDFNADDRRQGEHLTAQAVNEVSHSQDLAAHEFCRRLHQGTPVTGYAPRILNYELLPRFTGMAERGRNSCRDRVGAAKRRASTDGETNEGMWIRAPFHGACGEVDSFSHWLPGALRRVLPVRPIPRHRGRSCAKRTAPARQLRIRPCPCTPHVISYPATAQE